ncbi:hypothetical protein Poly59_58060 [Rubripirellula reticaptiva]|uniref:Uncharacterized protein n=1 Tax=Rubripirellula reticaptiva TaxID=2528013 RepID=A0A5C6EAS0_9BACT|nr:hypothetical protein Poly59_58060 [Rubripirellula reticaptiva]
MPLKHPHRPILPTRSASPPMLGRRYLGDNSCAVSANCKCVRKILPTRWCFTTNACERFKILQQSACRIPLKQFLFRNYRVRPSRRQFLCQRGRLATNAKTTRSHVHQIPNRTTVDAALDAETTLFTCKVSSLTHHACLPCRRDGRSYFKANALSFARLSLTCWLVISEVAPS